MKNILLTSFAVVALFFLYSCGGSATQPDTANSPASKSGAPSGKDLYVKNCASCHMVNGEGIANTYPPLAKSDFLGDKVKAIGQVIKGKTGEIEVNGKKYNNVMPPQQLSDDEIASVLSYVYGSFGNAGSTVTAEDVKGARTKLQ